ncbi:MAG: hypothetical protein P1U90_17440 [Akkermansiaceae bacterium]|nr:hypothetical protein [Akkermansiaceae bacterium]
MPPKTQKYDSTTAASSLPKPAPPVTTAPVFSFRRSLVSSLRSELYDLAPQNQSNELFSTGHPHQATALGERASRPLPAIDWCSYADSGPVPA